MNKHFFICFGSQRGGTTWLSSQIRNHPDCSFPYRKELRYLDPLYYHPYRKVQMKRIFEFQEKLAELGSPENLPLQKNNAHELRWWARYAFVSKSECDDMWYESLFEHCDPSKVTGDFSPDYSLLPPKGVKHLRTVAPHAKLIFLIREPVDRLWSGVTYAVRTRKDLSLEQKSNLAHKNLDKPMQNAFSDYPKIIRNFELQFPKNRILYLFHDEISLNPYEILRQTCSHLDIDFDESYFPEISQKINSSPVIEMDPDIKIETTRRYISTLKWLSNRFGGHATRWENRAKKLLDCN
ncbi:MAG: sulfotransferase [Rhodobacteraceae bacterium]|nr:sulfotransferase [Paracoccaceae bacterium]